MIKLYHGSHIEVKQPLALAGRTNLDFGRGFYLMSIYEQAASWAKVIASRKSRNAAKPIVSVYNFDEEAVRRSSFNWRVFEEYNLDWLDYVVSCRKGSSVYQRYDIVEGGVANDNVIDTVEDYEKGIITAEQALGQLRYKHINHQICLVNQDVIDRHLQFVGIREEAEL